MPNDGSIHVQDSASVGVYESYSQSQTNDVLCCSECNFTEINQLLSRYQLTLNILDETQDIPGSFWGEPEAGLIRQTVYIRPDTPVHSLLHESCHAICMDPNRREQLHTDAGGVTDEENAVCYLQILLAEQISNFGRQRALADMDRWGYSFRLGSAQRWFEEDAEDAQAWLLSKHLIDSDNQPTFRLRQ